VSDDQNPTDPTAAPPTRLKPGDRYPIGAIALRHGPRSEVTLEVELLCLASGTLVVDQHLTYADDDGVRPNKGVGIVPSRIGELIALLRQGERAAIRMQQREDRR
jgi:hypothetical protein